jgi:hypothetical protein
MKTFVRFGRRLPIPSMTEIRHELRAFSAEEDIRSECAHAHPSPLPPGEGEMRRARNVAERLI